MSAFERGAMADRHPRLSWAVPASLLAVVVALALAPAASAYHRASKPTTKAMQADLPGRDCGGTRHVADAYVSTANPRYGLAYCGGGGHFMNILRRSAPDREDWRVAFSIGDGIQPCSALKRHVPAPVLRDLRIGGVTRSGAERIC